MHTKVLMKQLLCLLALIAFSVTFVNSSGHAEGPDAVMEQTGPVKKQDTAQAGGYRLGPNDVVDVTVFNEPDLSGDFKIDGSGSIAMPLVGSVQIGGLSLRQAEKAVAEKFRDGFLKDPSVSIEVKEHRPFYILGEVRRPGSYNYVVGMNGLKAIALSGGFTYRANRKVIQILRNGSPPGEKPHDEAVESAIRPGDIILVKERFF